MIAFGGPEVCGACRTMMHGPTEACPEPFVCLSGPDCPACESREIPSL